MGRAKGFLKIYSLLVFQEVARLMNAILYTMARLKYKVRHKNCLFGLKILFRFVGVRVGRGLGIGFGFLEYTESTDCIDSWHSKTFK